MEMFVSVQGLATNYVSRKYTCVHTRKSTQQNLSFQLILSMHFDVGTCHQTKLHIGAASHSDEKKYILLHLNCGDG